MVPGELVTQDPDAQLNYGFDWRPWLGEATIASSLFEVTGPDDALLKDSPAVASDGQQTSVRLSAGTVGYTYEIVNRIVTNETPPQTDDRALRVQILEND